MEKAKYVGAAAQARALLDGSPKERDLLTFLKDYPYIVRNALNSHAWNEVLVKAEFSLGGDYFADYLILSADSGAWHATLIELECPTARPFNKNGTSSQALNKGLAQLNDWAVWIEKNDAPFRARLSSLAELENVPAQCSKCCDHQLAHTELRDTRTVIHKRFVVVVGRRESFSDARTQAHRGKYHEQGREIASYDRLLDLAKNLDPTHVSGASQ